LAWAPALYLRNPKNERRNVAPHFPRRLRAPSPSRSRCRLRFLEVGGGRCRLRPPTFPSSAYRVGGRPASVLSLSFGRAPHLVGRAGSHMQAEGRSRHTCVVSNVFLSQASSSMPKSTDHLRRSERIRSPSYPVRTTWRLPEIMSVNFYEFLPFSCYKNSLISCSFVMYERGPPTMFFQ